ncbi:MAG: bifunctional phosphopantothenoylcysteine decarboxylase/phosphopantothenate--cysteine ligase CoaBC [Clostridiales bacterium]|nr:bifunctional phosphopantothenoylcysteine decarboxylase/phosphopantothenate--cysteine ligase CoaBC [Clostridiales bacterium]MDO5140534.1 bifunctional phosphopantothenoylcysteine decarboxylase/phosphopantothenate--cysteine ligase CoaBC [Eubacteriales bacterium]
MESLQGKCVVVGVTGGIAAYKSALLVSALKKTGADVHVIMTENAAQFITPLTFETLSNNKCMVDTFDRNFKYDVAHISIAKAADLIVIAPATANVIAKLAHGIADDMLTTVVLAAGCKKLVAPAMNTGMLENPITQDNIRTLEKYGFGIIPSECGLLACKDVGSGKLPDTQVIMDWILRELAFEKDLEGLTIAVSAGPTREAIDPVRYISNKSSGKMGYSIARAAMLRGARVRLISGQTGLEPVPFADNIRITSTREMYEAFKKALPDTDIVIKAAAVADYRPSVVAENKIKKTDGDMSIGLERTEDIISYCGQNRHPGLFLCGFSMETENMLENSRKKLKKKNLDMIVANNLKQAGAGFAVDTNIVTIITEDGVTELPIMDKDEVAHRLLDEIVRRRKLASGSIDN